MGDMLSLAEAAALIRKSEKTIYRYVRQKKLPAVKYENNGRQIYKIRKTDLVKFSEQMRIAMGDNMSLSENLNSQDVTHNVTNSSIKAIVEEVINSQREQLMKPMEQQALFLAGKYQAENEFLREQVETLRNELDAVKALPMDIAAKDEEIRTLQEQMKLLPDMEEMILIREENEQYKVSLLTGKDTIEKLNEDKQILEEELETKKKELSILPAEPVEVNKILMQNADNLKALQEKLNLLPAEPEKVNEILKLGVEKFKALEDNFVKQSGEKEHLEAELKKIQQEAEEMRQKLNKPWWKIW